MLRPKGARGLTYYRRSRHSAGARAPKQDRTKNRAPRCPVPFPARAWWQKKAE